MSNSKEPILLIDTMGLVHSGFGARDSYYLNSQGKDISAIDATFNSINSILKKYTPKHLAFICDVPGGSFRNEIYAEYKANRANRDPKLAEQLPVIPEFLRTLGFPVFAVPGYEADDVIGTIAKHFSALGYPVTIYSRDKDFLQLIDENITLEYGNNKHTIENGHEKFKVPLEYTLDYLAICGDNADNIPGITGMGEGSAQDLINTYGNLDQIYQHVDDGTFNLTTSKYKTLKKIMEVMQQDRELAYLSYKLATIKTDVELGNLEIEQFTVAPVDAEKVVNLFNEWEITARLEKIVGDKSSFYSHNLDIREQLKYYISLHPLRKFEYFKEPKPVIESKSKTTELDLFENKKKTKKSKNKEGKPEEQYQLTDRDIELQTSFARLEGNFQQLLEQANNQQLVDTTLYFIEAEETVVSHATTHSIAASVIKHISSNSHEPEEATSIFQEEISKKVSRWVNALKPALTQIQKLSSHTVSVGINVQGDKSQGILSSIGISLVHRKSEDSSVSIPRNYLEFTTQDLTTTCFTWNAQESWNELDKTDLITFYNVLREQLIKPLFYVNHDELIDTSLNLPLATNAQVFVKNLQQLLSILNFSIKETSLIADHVHDIEVVGFCRNSNFNTNVFNDVATNIMGININSTDFEQACILLPIMGLMLSAVLEQPFYRNVEQQLYKCLYHMQCHALPISSEKLHYAEKCVEQIKTQYQNEVFEIAGVEFNITRDSELRGILFDHLQIETKNRSIAKEQLRNYNRPIIKPIAEYRKLAKNDPVTSFKNSIQETDTGDYFINFNFSQYNSSSSEIVFADSEISKLMKDDQLLEYIRNSFSAYPNHSFVSFAYRNLVLAVAAYLSQDENLIKVINDGRDIYTLIAEQMFNIEYDKIQPRHYNLAKTISKSFGCGTRDIVSELLETEQVVKRSREEYYNYFPQLLSYIEQLYGRAANTQFIETLRGRLILVPYLKDRSKFNLVGLDKAKVYQEQFVDYASNIIKEALLKIHQAILHEMPEIMLHLSTQNGFLVSIPDDHVATYAPKIQQIMESCINLPGVNVPVQYHVDKYWTGNDLIP